MSINTSDQCNNNSTGQISILPVCVYSFNFILGLACNVPALAFFFSHATTRSQTTIYMTNLAIADSMLLLTLPMRIYYHLGFAGLPQWLCDVLGLVLKANMYGSIFLLTCICFDRCMAVSFPMSARVQEARRKAPLFCLGIWILTFGASLPIYLSSRSQLSSSDKNCFDNIPAYAIQLAVVVPTLIFGFSIPLLVMLICSWGLLRAVRQSTVAQTKLVDGRKINRMIAVSLLIFLLSFLRYHCILLLLFLYQENISCLMRSAYRYSLMIACINTVLDPVAYYFTTETFRSKIEISVVQRMFPLSSHSSAVNSRDRDII